MLIIYMHTSQERGQPPLLRKTFDQQMLFFYTWKSILQDTYYVLI